MSINTILPNHLRAEHAANLKLGCGNFLHEAVKLSPTADQQHIWMDTSCRIFTGEVFDGFSLTQLKHVVDTYASWYYGAGVRPKDPIGVFVSEGIENLIHYLALNAIGAIPAVVNGNMPPHIAALWFEKVGVVGLYSDKRLSPLIAPHLKKNEGLRFFVTDETAAPVYKPKLPAIYPFQHADHDTVLVGHSSGTTGIPKAVQFQHQQFFFGIRYRLSLPFPGGSEKILSALPHSHSAGIAYLMLALLNGSSTMVLSSNQPEVVLPGIDAFQPSMFVAFPECYVALSESNLEAHNLDSIQLWFNGGDAAHEAHIRRLIEQGHHMVDGQKMKGSIFIDGLGSSEMGFSLFRNVHTLKTSNYNRCIGKPLDWVDAAVLDDDGQKLPPYRVGKLGVKSPSITPGYWNDSVLTARSQLGSYFLTGDLFYYDDEGRFFHVDRVPDLIRTKDGNFYSLESEELILRNFRGVIDCSIVGVPSGDFQEAVAVVRLRSGVEVEETELCGHVNDMLRRLQKLPVSRILFGKLSDFPLGPTGKVLKRELREQLKGTLGRNLNSNVNLEPMHA